MKIVGFYWEGGSELLRVRCKIGQADMNFNFKKEIISDYIVNRKEITTLEEWKEIVENAIKEMVHSNEEFKIDLQKKLDGIDIEQNELINVDINIGDLSKDYRQVVKENFF